MIDHYNAFISYKHEPKDIAIARNVQKSIERYRIPKKLRESTGVNKIDRIFRDTDELPLTEMGIKSAEMIQVIYLKLFMML